MCNILPGFDIRSVEMVWFFSSRNARTRYEDCKQRFKAEGRSTQERWVFHGTPREEWALSIMAEGFRVGGQNGHPIKNGDVHGQGVYTDQSPSTATKYGKFVVLSLAVPGKELAHAPTDPNRHTQDYDSWHPSSIPQKMWNVFKSADQLLPLYVVYMK